MAYNESHQSLGAHPKTLKLARLLAISVPTTIGHLQFFWWWALDYAPDGNVSQFDALDIAIGAQWDGEPDSFLAGLIAVRFLDHDEGGTWIHDWDQYGGKLLHRKESNARRMRERRATYESGTENDVQRTYGTRVEHVAKCAEPEKRRGEKRREEQRPPLPPNVTPPPSHYIETLNGALPKLEKLFQQIDQDLFTPSWLRGVLVEAERAVGPLSRDQLGRGLNVAMKEMGRRMTSEKPPTSPRPYARKLIVDYLTEQREGHHASRH